MVKTRFCSSFWVAVARLVVVTSFSHAFVACARQDHAGAGEPASLPVARPATGSGGNAKASSPASTRKVVRSAELSLEVDSPATAQGELSKIVEQAGGYVASAERSLSADEGERDVGLVSLVLRVPSDKLEATLARLKRLGRGAENERLGSEDVSDEYIDLTARIANAKRLEDTLGALLARASSVESALQVHKELANVRTEIDRMEGRRQFLEKETDFAKISVTLSALRPPATVSLAEFAVSLRRATADSLSLGAAVVLGGVRLLGVLTPIFLLVGAPGWGILRLVRRRHAGMKTTLSG